MFDTDLDWPPPSVSPDEVIDRLVDDRPALGEPVRWSKYVPDGLWADMLARPAATGPVHQEWEALERIGGWEQIIAPLVVPCVR